MVKVVDMQACARGRAGSEGIVGRIGRALRDDSSFNDRGRIFELCADRHCVTDAYITGEICLVWYRCCLLSLFSQFMRISL